MKLNKQIRHIGGWFKKHAPKLLTGLSIAGVGVTAYTAYRAAWKDEGSYEWHSSINNHYDPKALKKELVVNKIPMIASIAGTSAVILLNHSLNSRKKAELAGYCAMMLKVINDYQSAVLEKAPDHFNEVNFEVMQKNPEFFDKVEEVKAITFTDYGCLACDSVDLGAGGDQLFYDSFCDRWFRSSLLAVTAAEYHLNRNFALGGIVGLDMFYGFLGLGIPAEFENFGWEGMKLTEDWGACWIDFGHNYICDGVGGEEPYYELIYVQEPIDCSELY